MPCGGRAVRMIDINEKQQRTKNHLSPTTDCRHGHVMRTVARGLCLAEYALNEREARTRWDIAFLNACSREVPVAAWTSCLSSLVHHIRDRGNDPDSAKRQQDRVRLRSNGRQHQPSRQRPARRARHGAPRRGWCIRGVRSYLRTPRMHHPRLCSLVCSLVAHFMFAGDPIDSGPACKVSSASAQQRRKLKDLKTQRNDVAAAAPGHPTCARAREHTETAHTGGDAAAPPGYPRSYLSRAVAPLHCDRLPQL